MATDYSVQLRGVEGVASADPSTAMRAEQMRGQVVSQAIGAGAETIFDAYKGFKEEGVREKLQSDRDNLQWEMDAIKDAEQRNNLLAQTTERTPAAVKAFEAEQKRIGEAILQMPERAAEWRMRSSKALREAIAKTPGMANTFRQVAQQVTGIKDLDMYSVTNLYDEIDMVAKRQQQTQQAAAKADEEGRKLWIKDMAPFMSETQANDMWPKLTQEQKVQIAQDGFATEQSKKRLKESIEAGGQNLQNSMVNFVSQANTGNVAKMNEIRVQLREAGISEQMLLSGKMTPDGMANPKAQSLLAQAAAVHRQYIEQQYREGNALLQSALQKGAVNAESARTSQTILDNFYKNSLESLEKNGAVPLLQAMVGATADPEKTIASRVALANSIDNALGIDPLTRKEFQVEDPVAVAQLKARYPQKYAALKHVEEMRLAAMSGIPSQEWLTLVAKGREIAQKAKIEVPKTKTDATAATIYAEDAAQRMSKAYRLGESNQKDTLIAISGGFSLRDSGEALLKTHSIGLSGQLSMIPQGEKQAFMQQVKQHFNESVYMPQMHGDTAWARLQEVIPKYERLDSKLVMLDPTGSTPLKMGSIHKNTKPMENYSSVSLTGPNETKGVNDVLTTVDTAIRVRSLVTGEDVRVLRKEFMDTFMKGKPSEVYTSAVSGAAIAAAQQPSSQTGATLGGDAAAVRIREDIAALERELARIQKKPSWLSEKAWQGQIQVLTEELNAAKEKQ